MCRIAFNLLVAIVAFTIGVGVARVWRWAWAAPEAKEKRPTSCRAPIEPRISAGPRIRSVDFGNYTYPWPSDLRVPGDPREAFTLRDGELPPTRDARGFIDSIGISLASRYYGDVTGDGAEEALVVLGIQTGGSAIPHCVYIYTWHQARPKLLWSFVTGDRAEGGLRQVYAHNGELLIELWGKNAIVGRDLYESENPRPLCCPDHYTRAHYEWRKGRFRLMREEVVPSPVGGAAMLMRSEESTRRPGE